jgi:hypothetical protein
MHSHISAAIVKISRNFIKLKQKHTRRSNAKAMTIASFVTTIQFLVHTGEVRWL